MIVVAVSSGTSVDAIDVAAASFEVSGDVLDLHPLGHREAPWPGNLRGRILAASAGATTTVDEVTKLHTLCGQAFAEAADTVAREIGAQPDLAVSHGQTMFHWVEGARALGTLQIGEPAWIAERLGVPVVSNLRSRDIAAGGHGAPLASTLDAWWLPELAERTGTGAVAALNLGGIANATVRSAGELTSYDLGPGNCLIDEAAARVTSGAQRYDADGAIADSGQVDAVLLRALLSDPYFALQPPKSTGREYFTLRWVERAMAERVDGADLVATMTELTARTVADELRGADLVVASGGGTRNPVLMRALAGHLPDARVATTAEFGLDPSAKEAYLFALLGYLTATGRPGTVRAGSGEATTTGARGPRVLGDITPGPRCWCPPEPSGAAPRRLRIG